MNLLERVRLVRHAPEQQGDTPDIVLWIPEQDVLFNGEVVRRFVATKDRADPHVAHQRALLNGGHGLFWSDPTNGTHTPDNQPLAIGPEQQSKRLNPTGR